jgi:hypothetical protein
MSESINRHELLKFLGDLKREKPRSLETELTMNKIIDHVATMGLEKPASNYYAHLDMWDDVINDTDISTQECNHTQGEPGSLIDCVNPYSGKCRRCGKQVKARFLTGGGA